MLNVNSLGHVIDPNVRPSINAHIERGELLSVTPIRGLRELFTIPPAEVFRHPVVSRKNPTEAASASW